MKDNTTITVSRDTQKELMLYKLKSNARNLNDVIKVIIKKLKEELHGVENAPDVLKGERNEN